MATARDGKHCWLSGRHSALCGRPRGAAGTHRIGRGSRLRDHGNLVGPLAHTGTADGLVGRAVATATLHVVL